MPGSTTAPWKPAEAKAVLDRRREIEEVEQSFQFRQSRSPVVRHLLERLRREAAPWIEELERRTTDYLMTGDKGPLGGCTIGSGSVCDIVSKDADPLWAELKQAKAKAKAWTPTPVGPWSDPQPLIDLEKSLETIGDGLAVPSQSKQDDEELGRIRDQLQALSTQVAPALEELDRRAAIYLASPDPKNTPVWTSLTCRGGNFDCRSLLVSKGSHPLWAAIRRARAAEPPVELWPDDWRRDDFGRRSLQLRRSLRNIAVSANADDTVPAALRAELQRVVAMHQPLFLEVKDRADAYWRSPTRQNAQRLGFDNAKDAANELKVEK